LENDQAHPISALVSIRQQRKDGALSGSHTFSDGHRPGCIYDEEHQVGGALHPYFTLKISWLNGKSHTFTLFFTPLLVGCCGAEGSIKSQIGSLPFRRSGTYITPTLAFSMGARAAPALFSGKFIQGRINLARGESLSNLCFFAAFPP
jgi:hypothetical protein